MARRRPVATARHDRRARRSTTSTSRRSAGGSPTTSPCPTSGTSSGRSSTRPSAAARHSASSSSAGRVHASREALVGFVARRRSSASGSAILFVHSRLAERALRAVRRRVARRSRSWPSRRSSSSRSRPDWLSVMVDRDLPDVLPGHDRDRSAACASFDPRALELFRSYAASRRQILLAAAPAGVGAVPVHGAPGRGRRVASSARSSASRPGGVAGRASAARSSTTTSTTRRARSSCGRRSSCAALARASFFVGIVRLAEGIAHARPLPAGGGTAVTVRSRPPGRDRPPATASVGRGCRRRQGLRRPATARPTVALEGIDLTIAPGRVRLAHRPVGLRQVDAAAAHRRPDPRRRAGDGRGQRQARRARPASTATTGWSSRRRSCSTGGPSRRTSSCRSRSWATPADERTTRAQRAARPRRARRTSPSAIPWQLSGGMQQRVAIARALVVRARAPAHGRAVRRARRDDPRADERRGAAHLAADRDDDRVRHPLASPRPSSCRRASSS